MKVSKHQVDYERELFKTDREKWKAHMRDKLWKHEQRKEAVKPTPESRKAEDARTSEFLREMA